jgi:restriction endonuclease S subunit
MPQNWKTYKLKEICDLIVDCPHSTPKWKDNGITVLRSNNIRNGKLNFNKQSYTDEEHYKQRTKRAIPQKGDLVITREAPMGEVCMLPAGLKCCLGQRMVLVRPSSQVNNSFLLYAIQAREVQDQIMVYEGTGSTVSNLRIPVLESLVIPYPELSEQQAIAEILSSLDDKIEFNLQMNKTLEEMAMTLYKHWFVDFEFPSSGGVDFIEDERRGGNFSSPAEKPEVRGSRNTANYMSLPYNPALKERAKALRKAGNLAEVLFWQQVHRKKFLGLDFDRQKIIGNYIVDFYCANVQVVIEIDGSSHDGKEEYDAARDAYLEGLGLTVIHITDEAVKKDLAETMEDVKNHPAFQAPLRRRGMDSGEESAPLQRRGMDGAEKAPLQGRGSVGGYKSSGGKFIDSELGPIPEGWEVKNMVDIIPVKDGTHDSPKQTENGHYLITSKHIKQNEIDLSKAYKISEADFTKVNKRSKVDEGDILMTMIGTVGVFHLVTNTPNYAIKNIGLFKTSVIPELKHFLFLFFKSDYGNVFIKSQLAGSTQQYLTLKTLRGFPVLYPDTNLVNRFDQLVAQYFQKISNNILENQTLTNLRDTLLPKLISGEVRVKDVERTVAEVL